MSVDTIILNKSQSRLTFGDNLSRVVSSVLDLSGLFLEGNDIYAPPVDESEVSYDSEEEEDGDYKIEASVSAPEDIILPPRFKQNQLQWEFYGLTLWLELEEFDYDITNAIHDVATKYNVEEIPKSHTTAIYGMTHLTIDQAKEKLRDVKHVLKGETWPSFACPTAVVQDIAVAGRPGQVCSVAWCELTLSTNEEHEEALDSLYKLFYEDSFGRDEKQGNHCDVVSRNRPWKPHNSFAYDNPENSKFSLADAIAYVAIHPSLISKERRVEAISLWDTNGKMGDWKCLDRVYF